MNKTEKRMKIFSLIMQVIIQAVLLFPWMNMGTWKCNVPGYLIKLATSGDGMSYIKKSLKPLGVLDGADEQMMVQILMLFICELVMVLVIQVIGIVNLILALSNHHKLLLDIMSLIAGCMISFLGADGAVFSDPLSQVYPFLLVVLLVINLIGAKLIDSWQEEKKIQEEIPQDHQSNPGYSDQDKTCNQICESCNLRRLCSHSGSCHEDSADDTQDHTSDAGSPDQHSQNSSHNLFSKHFIKCRLPHSQSRKYTVISHPFSEI